MSGPRSPLSLRPGLRMKSGSSWCRLLTREAWWRHCSRRMCLRTSMGGQYLMELEVFQSSRWWMDRFRNFRGSSPTWFRPTPSRSALMATTGSSPTWASSPFWSRTQIRTGSLTARISHHASTCSGFLQLGSRTWGSTSWWMQRPLEVRKESKFTLLCRCSRWDGSVPSRWFRVLWGLWFLRRPRCPCCQRFQSSSPSPSRMIWPWSTWIPLMSYVAWSAAVRRLWVARCRSAMNVSWRFAKRRISLWMMGNAWLVQQKERCKGENLMGLQAATGWPVTRCAAWWACWARWWGRRSGQSLCSATLLEKPPLGCASGALCSLCFRRPSGRSSGVWSRTIPWNPRMKRWMRCFWCSRWCPLCSPTFVRWWMTR